jgi:hypothetical protein
MRADRMCRSGKSSGCAAGARSPTGAGKWRIGRFIGGLLSTH